MGSSHPDLFVVCKNCGSEVSPYITECPYCGKRLRKRAPKLDRDGRVLEPEVKRRPLPKLPKLRRGEIPGIASDRRPVVTIALVMLGIVGTLIWRVGDDFYYRLTVIGSIGNHWWRPITSPFIYASTGYAFVALTAIMIFGTLVERRSGPAMVVALFVVGSIGGALLTSILDSTATAAGANGAALALIVAWALPGLRRLRKGREFDGDLIGTSVCFLVVAAMPAATLEASAVSGLTGIVAGFVLGGAALLAGRA